ncbi:MAG: hypothetical protein V8S69_07110 [Dakarella massiliensis]
MENILQFTKRLSLAASAAAVCALTLAGCQTTGQKTASAFHSGIFFGRGRKRQPL